MTDVKITHIEAEPSDSAVDSLQIVITPGNDPDIGERVFGFKDGAGNPHKCLNKSAHAPVKSLNVSDFTAVGILRTDSSGDIYGDVNSLGDLNTALGGTTIDESTDPRDPNAHAIGGAAHSASTLAELNTKVSDATLDDSGDPRPPTQHAIGSATYHSASTISEFNALISDATLDDSSASRPPTAHAGSHESGGSDQLEHNKFYDLNTGDYRHVDPSPAAGGTGWEVTDSDFTALGDSVSSKPHGTTLVQQITNASGADDRSFVAFDTYFATYNSTTDVLYKIDKNTGEILNSKALSVPLGSYHAVPLVNLLLCPLPTGMRIINMDDLSESSATITPSASGVRGACIASDGTIYVVSNTTVYKIVESGGNYTSTSFAPAITDIQEISCDDTYLYLVDNASGYYVRQLDRSDDSLVASAGPFAGSFRALGVLKSGHLVLHVSGTKIIDVSDMSVKINLTETTINGGSSYVDEDIINTVDTSYIYRYAVPALTLKAPRNIDLTGVKSSTYNNGSGIYSLDDFCRATEHSKDTTIHLTATQKTDLVDGGESTAHYHAADRDRANHTGTQAASTISDFDTEVSNNTDVAANTAARHDAVTVADTAEIDMSITGQQVSATIVAGSIDETKLDTSVNASLDLADSAVQPTDTEYVDITDGGPTVRHTHLGIIEVESVEDTTPVSPSTGEYYLFSASHPTQPNDVAYYDGTTWEYISPKNGDTVQMGFFTFTYNIDQWEKRFELVYSTTLTISNGVAGPSTTVYIPALTQTGEVIAVDHASMMAFQQASNGRFAILREMMIGYHGVIMSTARKEMESLGAGITASDFYAEAGNPSSGDLNLTFELTGTPTYDAVYNVTFKVSGSIQTGVADFCS